jgi:hypothetical protein
MHSKKPYKTRLLKTPTREMTLKVVPAQDRQFFG